MSGIRPPSSSESPSSELLGFPPLSEAGTVPLLQLLAFDLSLTRPKTLYKVYSLGFLVGLSLNGMKRESSTTCRLPTMCVSFPVKITAPYTFLPITNPHGVFHAKLLMTHANRLGSAPYPEPRSQGEAYGSPFHRSPYLVTCGCSLLSLVLESGLPVCLPHWDDVLPVLNFPSFLVTGKPVSLVVIIEFIRKLPAPSYRVHA